MKPLSIFGMFTATIFCLLAFACAKGNGQLAPKTDPVFPPFADSVVTTFLGGTTLSAIGTGDTYSLINKQFGGTGDVVESPDCAHPTGAPHIQQVYDVDLKKPVFAFTIHLTPDNDRCLPSTDRQRNEIKTYDKSPDSLLAKVGEAMEYKWKFKLDKNFKPSPNFTHLHQLKAIDGDADSPLITLTARYKSSGNKLEVIHTAGIGKTTSLGYLASIPLSYFLGNWVEVTEKATFKTEGTYQIVIKRISDGKELLNMKKDNIDLWREGTTQCRPKWGIYRSLLSSTYLRDETVMFNDFNIKKHK